MLDDPLAVRIVGDAVQEIHQKPALHRWCTRRHLRAFMVEPEELDALLDGLGFRRIEQLAAKEINEQYFAHREDSLKVSEAAGRIVSAWT